MFKSALLVFVWVLFGVVPVMAEGGPTTQIAPEGAPQVVTVAPSGDAKIPACRYPKFESGGTSNNPSCVATLRSPKISLAPRSGTCPSAFVTVGGLEKQISIPVENRSTATVLVNWTVRVEGVSRVVDPHAFCGGKFAGTTPQSFPGGKVSTHLVVNNEIMGLPSDMTIPDSGIVNVTSVADPTISGSYVIKPQDFSNGKLPQKLNIKVEWNNDTCMEALSRAGFRSMVITLVPQGNQ